MNKRRFGLLLAWSGLLLAAWLLTAQALASRPAPVRPEGARPESQLVVSPTLLWARVPSGQEQVQHLFVGNAGLTATMEFTLTALPFAQTEGIVPWLDFWPAGGVLSPTSQVTIDLTFTALPYLPVGSLEQARLRVDSDSLVTPTAYTVPLLLEVIEAPEPIRVYLPAVARGYEAE